MSRLIEYQGLHLTQEIIDAIERNREQFKSRICKEISDSIDNAILKELRNKESDNE